MMRWKSWIRLPLIGRRKNGRNLQKNITEVRKTWTNGLALKAVRACSS